MSVETQNTCRLCLNNIQDSNVELIDKSTVEAFELLSLNLNWNLSNAPVMCSTCSHCLKKCVAFKSVCLNVEGSIKHFIDKESEVNLTKVYKELKGNSNIIANVDHKICRLCLNLVGNNFKSLEEEGISDMVHEYIPHLNFHISSDPILCLTCLDTFRCYVTFVSSCSNVEEEIIKYIDTVGSDPNGCIKLIKVARFAQKNIDSIASSHCGGMAIKVETEKIKTEICEQDYFVPVDCGEMKMCKEDINEVGNSDKFYLEGDEASIEAFRSMKRENNDKNMTGSMEALLSNVKTELCDVLEENDGESFRYDVNVDLSDEKAKTEIKWEDDVDSFNPSPATKHEDVTCQDSQNPYLYDHDSISFYNLGSYTLTQEQKQEILHQTQTEKFVDGTANKTTEVKFKCDSCGYNTKSKAFLTRHLKSHRDQSRKRATAQTYKCDKCDYESTQKYRLREHGLIHKDPSEVPLYECEHCGLKTKWKNTLQKHSLLHKDRSELPVHSCDQCEFTTKSKSYFHQHTLVHKAGITHKCDICNFETTFVSYLKRHLLSHRSASDMYTCPKCRYKMYTRESFDRHMAKHVDGRYRCEICGYNANRKCRLKEHMLTHKDNTEVRVYECERCSFQTKWKNTFNKHRSLHDEPSEAAKYKCELCDYRTSYRSHLNRHSIVHKDLSQLEMHKCERCDFQTKTRHNLKMHMVTHVDLAELDRNGGLVNGERIPVFECDRCPYRAKRKGELVRHMAQHRTVPQAKPFKCGECDYRTEYRNRLTTHSLVHKSAAELKMYRCELCSFETKWAQSVNAHKLTHKLKA